MLEQTIPCPDTAQLGHPLGVDPSTPNGNNFARGLAILLRHAGCETDYVTVMGDLGEAFIMPGAEYDTRLTGGYADLGWWPLDRWHIVSRLPFLSWAHGVELHHHDVDFGGVGSDPARTYARLFQATVCQEITHGRALLACWDGCHVVTGYDTQKPPLVGWNLFGDRPAHGRMSNYPCALTTYGSPCDPMDRQFADGIALQHVADLGRGRIKCGLWVTGPLAWKGWEENLVKRPTQAWWHNSIRGALQTTRDAAVEYLESMALRHSDAVSVHLGKAAGIYGQQLHLVRQMPSFTEITVPERAQSELANLIRKAAALDLEAIDSIEAAASLLPE